MADNKEKNRQSDAPEIFMDKSHGRILSKQSLLLTISNCKIANEDLSKDFNKSNKKYKTIDSFKTPLFANDLHNTDSIHTQVKEDNDAIT